MFVREDMVTYAVKKMKQGKAGGPYLAFVGLEKAFDQLPHSILRHLGSKTKCGTV